MWVVPLAASVIAIGFAVLLGRQYLLSRRAPNLMWTVALLMYAGASLALCLGVLDGWGTAEYRWYWLLGAVLNVPYLASGEILLLARDPRVRWPVVVLLLFLTAFALARVRTATLDVAALGVDLPRGREVWAGDPFALQLARLYAFPAYVVLVGGTLWSAWRMRGHPDLRDRFTGTLAIAVGATIVAVGSAFALSGNLVGFALTLVVGIAVMFWGFLRASRPIAQARPSGDA